MPVYSRAHFHCRQWYKRAGLEPHRAVLSHLRAALSHYRSAIGPAWRFLRLHRDLIKVEYITSRTKISNPHFNAIYGPVGRTYLKYATRAFFNNDRLTV